jgi:ADP-ribose pyrophosphatase
MKNIKKWELLAEEDISPSRFFPLFKHKVKLSNEKVIDDFYLSRLGDVSMVIPITKDKKIVFVRQYKHGAGDILIELPAGRINKNETSKENAMRELIEETGYTPSKIIEVGSKVIPSPTKDTTKVFGFIALDLVKGEQNLDENEDIEVLEIPIDEIDDYISSGKIIASDTIATLYFAKLKFPEYFK